MRTQVVIVGSGPAGLLLAHLLRAADVGVLVVERRSRAHVEARIRAGILEAGTVGILEHLGLDARLKSEGLVHGGFELAFDGEPLRVALDELTGGRSVTVYGQTELTRDLIAAACDRDVPIVFEADEVALDGLDTASPTVSYLSGGRRTHISCDFVAGCDGYHGICRASAPAGAFRVYERAYPFAWLGLLADVPPCSDELIYASHDRGFALASMRSPTRSRYYVQVPAGERLEDWPDDRFWDEAGARLGPAAAARITRGPALEKSIAPLRSFVVEPLRFGRLFLAGDAAHIVPPTGAKGLNLAASDVAYLAGAFISHFDGGGDAGLEDYSARALARVWKASRFSWWFTSLTHRLGDGDAFARRLQAAEFDYLRSSSAAQRALAENYAGLPL